MLLRRDAALLTGAAGVLLPLTAAAGVLLPRRAITPGTKRASVTLAPSVPPLTAWMSQPCCSGDMAETSTPYKSGGGAAGSPLHGPRQ